MHAALADGARVVALLSPDYLSSAHCQAEWQNAIAGDPLNERSRLILLRVAECEPPGLLSGLAYWDLVPVRDDRALLAEIVRVAVREGRRDAAPAAPHWRAPRAITDGEAIRPVPGFSGREDELAPSAGATPRRRRRDLRLGRRGQVVARARIRVAQPRRYAVVWWLNAQTEEPSSSRCFAWVRCSCAASISWPTGARPRSKSQVPCSRLRQARLLIFDNLDDERLLRTWLPRSGARGLLTSRNAAWGSDVTAIALPPWPRETAAKYLRRESGRADLTDDDARGLADALGSLPLALSHAAASLRDVRMMTPRRYLERMGGISPRRRGLRSTRSRFLLPTPPRSPRPSSRLRAPPRCCRLRRSSRPTPYPTNCSAKMRDSIRRGFPATTRAWTTRWVRSTASRCSRSRSNRARTRIHRLVQLAARDRAGDGAAWAAAAVAAADAAWPGVEFEAWPQCERLAPHARAALEGLPGDAATEPAARLAAASAVYLRERADYAASEALQTRALAMRERIFGAEHPEVAASLNELGIVYTAQGNYDDANRCYLRAQAIVEEALGPEHRDVGVSLNSLGCSYYEQGRYEEAAAAIARALAIWEKALGPEHSNVARALGNLAGAHYAQGRYDEAEPLARRALEFTERAHGPDHPNVGIYLNNVAEMEYRLGRYDESERLLARALALWERALDADHPDVAITLNVAGEVHEAQGRLGDAERAHARALEIREKALGPNHSAVATSLEGLASVYRRQERYAEAASLLARAVAIRERVLGEEHELTAATREALAAVQAIVTSRP